MHSTIKLGTRKPIRKLTAPVGAAAAAAAAAAALQGRLEQRFLTIEAYVCGRLNY
jgi:hypothetical protein